MKTSRNGLIDTDVYGTQEQVKEYSIFQNLYKDFYDLDFKNTFFAINLIKFDPEKLLDHCYDNIFISIHFEYIDYPLMYDTFNDNKNKRFLLLTDFSFPDNKYDSDAKTQFWPDNVTIIQWTSLGEQFNSFISQCGIADGPRFPSKKISSLSHRHEFHRSAITAFIVNNFPQSDTILSWHNWSPKDDNIYYLQDDYYIDARIKKQIFDLKFDYQTKIFLDEPELDLSYFRNPLKNCYWNMPCYLDAIFNVTNETAFSSIGTLNDDTPVVLPGPLVTEKTIKPLLAGAAFISVGQPFLLKYLEELGFKTRFGLPTHYDDEIYEDNRILKIYDVLEFILNTPFDDLYKNSYFDILHNLEYIKSGHFNKNCEIFNRKNIGKIYEWSLINP